MISDIRNWIKRIRLEIVLLVLSGAGLIYFGISMGNFEIILYKIFLLALAVSIVHLSRQFLFPDIGLWRLIYGKTEEAKQVDPIIRAAAVLGILIFMAVVISAFMQGV